MLSLSQIHNQNTTVDSSAEKSGTVGIMPNSSFIIQKHKFAVIDMGSNSFRLCIFNDSLPIETSKVKFVQTCRLGEGFHDSLEIQPVPMARALKTCGDFLEICRENSVDNIYCFATAVVREAKNREEFISSAQKLGLKIHILSGEQEALCGFLGAYGGLSDGFCNGSKSSPKKNTNIAVFDIGGASFEIAIGNCKGFKGLFECNTELPTYEDIIEKSKGTHCGLDFSPLKFSQSFKVGAVRATDIFDENFAMLSGFLEGMFSGFDESQERALNLSQTKCIGIGGTITSLCGLLKGCENFKNELHGFECTRADICAEVARIQQMSPQNRLSLPYLKDKRKEIIAAGGEILSRSMIHFRAESITASLSDNLEGYRLYLGI